MKHLLVALLGLALGTAAACAVLYYNPLADERTAVPGAADRVFRYSLPDDVLELELGDDARWLGLAATNATLWEETIARSAVVGLVLKNVANEPEAIASRLMATSPETDLLLRGLLVSDYWLVTVPGEGTLFLRADSNAWPFVKEAFLPVKYFDRPWPGPAEYWPTVGPGADRGGIVIGVAGSFGANAGRVVERYELTALDPARGVAAADAELHVSLTAPEVPLRQEAP